MIKPPLNIKTPKREKGERKSYVSYAADRASLAKIVLHNRPKDAQYSEGDAIREALEEKAARIK